MSLIKDNNLIIGQPKNYDNQYQDKNMVATIH